MRTTSRSCPACRTRRSGPLPPTPRPSSRSRRCSHGTACSGPSGTPFTRKLFAEEFPFASRKIARKIADGEELRFGDTRAVAVVAPGHTPGHLCLDFPDDGSVPRRLRPDGVRPVVRRRPVRHRRVPAVGTSPRRDRRGSIRGLPRGAGPPRPDSGEDGRVPRRDRPAGGGAAGLCTGAAHPRGDHRAAPDLRPGTRRSLVRLRRVGAPLQAPRGDDRSRRGRPPRRRLHVRRRPPLSYDTASMPVRSFPITRVWISYVPS